MRTAEGNEPRSINQEHRKEAIMDGIITQEKAQSRIYRMRWWTLVIVFGHCPVSDHRRNDSQRGYPVAATRPGNVGLVAAVDSQLVHGGLRWLALDDGRYR